MCPSGLPCVVVVVVVACSVSVCVDTITSTDDFDDTSREWLSEFNSLDDH